MPEIVIGSYFENNVGPLTGLSPTIRIWEIGGNGNALVVGAPCGLGSSVDGVMAEVGDCGSPPSAHDGFYQFIFTDTIGYDPTKTYVARVDAGPAIPTQFRYQVSDITPIVSADDVAFAVWEELRVDHISAGSMGEAISQTRANTIDIANQLYLGADSVLEIVRVLLKMESGRTKIDPVNHTLTVYDEDCVTPLRVFELLDSTGTPSVQDICERKPILKGTGDGTTITDPCV